MATFAVVTSEVSPIKSGGWISNKEFCASQDTTLRILRRMFN